MVKIVKSLSIQQSVCSRAVDKMPQPLYRFARRPAGVSPLPSKPAVPTKPAVLIAGRISLAIGVALIIGLAVRFGFTAAGAAVLMFMCGVVCRSAAIALGDG